MFSIAVTIGYEIADLPIWRCRLCRRVYSRRLCVVLVCL